MEGNIAMYASLAGVLYVYFIAVRYSYRKTYKNKD